MAQLNVYVLALFVSGGLLCVLTLRLFWKQGLIKYLPVLFLGLLLSGVGGVFIALGLGLLDYQIIPRDRTLATVYFTQTSDKSFSVQVKMSSGSQSSLTLQGDHWQVDAKTLSGDRRLPFDIQPLARLENFYVYSRSQKMQSVEIQRVPVGDRRFPVSLDTWQWLKKAPGLRALLNFEVTRTVRQPMLDKTVYRISMSNLGLVAEQTHGIPLTGPVK